MALALSLGRRGMGQVWPNPAVGCVLVQGNRIVGRGWTQPGGRPHAEVIALEQAGEAAKGATAFVSLEPCAHQGQTGPCCDALIASGVARVVTALADPDPRVAGEGHRRLEAAGVKVQTGLCGEEARRDHEGFLLNRTKGRPMVTLKLANSFDGRIATATGESQWITGPDARHMVHAMRARHDAIMVGGGTVRSDDPSLTVRGLGAVRQPVRIACSSRLTLPTQSQLFETAKEVPVWLCHGPAPRANNAEAWRNAGADLIEVPVIPGGQLDPHKVLEALGQRGITRLFCEGGGTMAASMLQADLVDHLVGFTAGIAIGAEGTPSIGAMGLDELAEAPRFRLLESRAVGPDVMHHWVRGAS